MIFGEIIALIIIISFFMIIPIIMVVGTIATLMLIIELIKSLFSKLKEKWEDMKEIWLLEEQLQEDPEDWIDI